MIKRNVERIITILAKLYPVVSVTGPRQSGKSTMLKKAFRDYEYITLEDKDDRDFANFDPRGFLDRHANRIIIDEAQYAPDLFSYIQTKVDASDKEGQYILSGSQNFLLLKNIQQSLAGRVGIVKLMPLSYRELSETKYSTELNDLMFNGGYPRIYDKSISPKIFFSDYIATYLNRDIEDILNVRNILPFNNFLRLCALRTGQILNISALANDAQISVNTAKQWLSVLETSYIVFPLYPFRKKIAKRLIKSPKLYFYDTGLLCYLLGIKSADKLNDHNLSGNVFENFIISEFVKNYLNDRENAYDLSFYRDSDGNEIDLIDSTEDANISVYEIKSTSTGTPGYAKQLNRISDVLGVDAANRNIIFTGSKYLKIGGANYVPWQTCDKIAALPD